MRRYLILVAILYLGLFTSCQKSEEIVSPYSTLIDISFDGSESATDSRVSYTSSGGQHLFKWSAGDATALIIPSTGGNDNLRFVATSAGKNSRFTGNVSTWSGAKNAFSLFPYKTTPYVITGGDDVSTATVRLSALDQEVKLGVANEYDNSYMVAVASGATAVNATNYDIPSFGFKQVMSVLKFNITDIPRGETLTGIGMRTDTDAFISSADVVMSTAVVVGAPTKVNQIFATIKGATTGATTEVNLSLFPVDLTNKRVYIYIKTSDGSGTTREYTISKTGMNFVRNTIYSATFAVPNSNYESTDYSKDGEVQTLQTHTAGTGIDLVIVGDGFTDKDMGAGGKYEQRMSEAMENFFSEEPYIRYRDRFDVYSVNAVSKNEVYEDGAETVFSCKFAGGNSTYIEGDDEKVFEYALKVPSIIKTNNLTVITVINSPTYAGTCWMYSNNASISYCPVVNGGGEPFRQIVAHEAGGHGFAKLNDEYSYSGSITAEAKTEYAKWAKLGWGANTDITNEPAIIRWAHILSDARYTDLVGVYEGAMTYQYGAYRPTETSIMDANVGGFNAPSREAIFKWIMELSGEVYSYENFVTYDAINRTQAAGAARKAQAARVDTKKFIPLAPPVVIDSEPNVRKKR